MNSVIKGAGYVLVHTPEMVVYNGTTQTTERVVNPESEYLKELRDHLRSYDTCVNYWPNQVYIGNATPDGEGGRKPSQCDALQFIRSRKETGTVLIMIQTEKEAF